jgi:hypothetical protein
MKYIVCLLGVAALLATTGCETGYYAAGTYSPDYYQGYGYGYSPGYYNHGYYGHGPYGRNYYGNGYYGHRGYYNTYPAYRGHGYWH